MNEQLPRSLRPHWFVFWGDREYHWEAEDDGETSNFRWIHSHCKRLYGHVFDIHKGAVLYLVIDHLREPISSGIFPR